MAFSISTIFHNGVGTEKDSKGTSKCRPEQRGGINLKPLPDGATSKSNVVKITDLRVGIHQDSKDSNKAVTKVQVNAGATDKSVQCDIKPGNKGSGGHKETHENITEILFNQTDLKVDNFAKRIEDA